MAHAPAAAPLPPRPRWQVPLLVGFCFGLGYGITHRLLALQLPSLVRLGQGFEVRAFPGTSLDSLRLRFGVDSQEVRGDLDLLQLEQQEGQSKPAATNSDTTNDAGVREPDAGLEPAPAAEPQPVAPRQEAPPAPQLPPPSQSDLPQSSPDAGL